MNLHLNNFTKIVFIVLFTASTSTLLAQRGKHDSSKAHYNKASFSLEQQAIIKTKKMTLFLDLSDNQQKAIKQINMDQLTKRKELKSQIKNSSENNRKLTDDEMFTRMNNRLDNRIALQREFKKILNDKQYTLWRTQQLLAREKKISSHKKDKRNKDLY